MVPARLERAGPHATGGAFNSVQLSAPPVVMRETFFEIRFTATAPR
ncbi:hypothetical protein FM112_05770 [Gulosibacter sp. 10]|nr:hypothetical protein FM112_05770 [Gulosibacter sp. 10]